jgi:hypothetical protein
MKINKLLKFLLIAAMPLMAGEESGGGFDVNENGEALGTGNEARLALLDRIANQADEVRQDEFVDIVDLDTGKTEPFTVQTAEGETQQLEDQTAAAEQAAALAAEQQEAASVGQPAALPKLKVNGQEVEITPELIAKAQKVVNADLYLSNAAALRQQAAEQAKPAVTAAPDQGEDLVALTRAIQMGSEEEAVEAIRKLKASGPSSDDIARTIDERVNFNTAIAQYRKDFSDIVSDPILNKLAVQRDAELVAAGDSRPYYERFAAVGSELRTWKQSLSPATPASKTEPNTVIVNSSKEVKKAAASGVPPSASAVTKSTVAEEKEESVQEVIQRIAASRGGPQSMFGAPKVA